MFSETDFLPTEEEIKKHLHIMKQTPYLTIDTEGTLNHPYSTTWGFSYATRGYRAYFPFNHISGANLDKRYLAWFKDVIENHPCLVFHHAKHDLRSLRSLGINYTGKFYCTMLMSHMVDENRFAQSLEAVSRAYGGEPKAKPKIMQDIIDKLGWQYIPSWMMSEYGAQDAFITDEAFYPLLSDFKEQGFDGELWDIEQDFVRLLMDMEDNGILIDKDLSQRELSRGLDTMAELEKEFGFNIGSPQQLGNYLINELKLPEILHPKTKRRTFNKDAMKIYDELLSINQDDRAKKILTYRGWAKTTSSNYKPYLELAHSDGRLRANFKQHGTKTGRLSCEKPNLQQIPRESSNDWNGHLKQAFIVEEGRTAWEADYSQLEFRLGAAVGKVEELISIFNDPSRDVFTEMASDLGMSRFNTKTLNYTIQFGGGAQRLSQVFGVSIPAARAIIKNYYGKYPGLAKATARAASLCLQNGFIEYWTNRRRHFWDPRDEARKAFNSWCQGGAFEIVKRRSLALKKEGILNSECRLDLQVHDSLRLDIENGKEKEYLPEIKRVLEDVQGFGVQFRVDIHPWPTSVGV